MENLPNVFISKIYVYAESMGYRFQVKLCMYDHSPKRSWFNRQDLNDLKVKVMFATGDVAQDLNDGAISLHEYHPTNASVALIGQDQFSVEEELDGFTKFSAVVEKNIMSQTDLYVYAACFIDGLEFGSDLFNKFYGPLSAEKIMVRGQVNEQSGYFYYPDTNEEYGGPVHGHQGTFMEGSEHTPDPHATVRYVAEENYKIVFPPLETELGFVGDVWQSAPQGPYNESLGGVYVPEDFPGPPPDDVITQLPGAETPGGPQSGAAQDPDIEAPDVNRPGVPDRLQDINFDVRDAVRRGIY